MVAARQGGPPGRACRNPLSMSSIELLHVSWVFDPLSQYASTLIPSPLFPLTCEKRAWWTPVAGGGENVYHVEAVLAQMRFYAPR